jgi:hypothetical protein
MRTNSGIPIFPLRPTLFIVQSISAKHPAQKNPSRAKFDRALNFLFHSHSTESLTA